METIIKTEDLHKIYGTGRSAVHAVHGVSLEVKQGEIILLMGPSGSGKTTLLSVIGGLLRPSQGDVLFKDQNVWALKQSSLSKFRLNNVGFIFQDFNLLEDLDALENVAIVLNLRGQKGVEVLQKSQGLLRKLGLENRMDHYPADLSGGEKQRVAIARALVNEPDLILADEPTANIDSKTGKEVMDMLDSLAKDLKKSLIIASHDWRIKDIADRILWMEDGQISEKREGLE